MITTGSLNDALENTGRSSTEPTDGFDLVPPLSPRYADAIERMSIRPEPSPPPGGPAPPPPPPPPAAADAPADALADALDDADARGASWAKAARLPSENSTLFSLRSPRSFFSAVAPPPR